MSLVETLGELVAQDRAAVPMTQQQLAEKLKGRKSTTAMRAWIAKLESGKLRRDVGAPMRRRLARVLMVDGAKYLTAPMVLPATVTEWRNDDMDVLPVILYVAQQQPANMSFAEFRRLCQAREMCAEIGVRFPDPLVGS